MVIREASPADVASIARVHVGTWLTAYAGIVRDDVLASRSLQKCEMRHREAIADQGRKCWTFVAEDATAGIVGFARGGPERSGNGVFRGEIYALYVLKEHQRHGAGRALAAAVAGRLMENGLPSMLIWALKDNPSRGFYESLGGRYIGEKEIIIGGDSLAEVAYGWEDVRLPTQHITGTPHDATTVQGDAPCSEQ